MDKKRELKNLLERFDGVFDCTMSFPAVNIVLNDGKNRIDSEIAGMARVYWKDGKCKLAVDDYRRYIDDLFDWYAANYEIVCLDISELEKEIQKIIFDRKLGKLGRAVRDFLKKRITVGELRQAYRNYEKEIYEKEIKEVKNENKI